MRFLLPGLWVKQDVYEDVRAGRQNNVCHAQRENWAEAGCKAIPGVEA